MSIVERVYQGGTLVVKDVPTEGEGNQISLGDAALIAQYVRYLDEKNILGDIEVTLLEVKQKFDS